MHFKNSRVIAADLSVFQEQKRNKVRKIESDKCIRNIIKQIHHYGRQQNAANILIHRQGTAVAILKRQMNKYAENTTKAADMKRYFILAK